MYLPAFVLGPLDQVEFNAITYEAHRQRDVALANLRREAAKPKPPEARSGPQDRFREPVPAPQH